MWQQSGCCLLFLELVSRTSVWQDPDPISHKLVWTRTLSFFLIHLYDRTLSYFRIHVYGRNPTAPLSPACMQPCGNGCAVLSYAMAPPRTGSACAPHVAVSEIVTVRCVCVNILCVFSKCTSVSFWNWLFKRSTLSEPGCADINPSQRIWVPQCFHQETDLWVRGFAKGILTQGIFHCVMYTFSKFRHPYLSLVSIGGAGACPQ